MKNARTAALLLTGALALAGCGTTQYVTGQAPTPAEAPEPTETPETAQDGDSTSEVGADAAADPADGSAPDTGLSAADSPLLAFGEAATFDDGLEVSADVIDTVAVSEVASTMCAVGDPLTVVELTVVNGTSARINPWEDFMGGLNAEYVDSTGYAVTADSVFDSPGYGHDYDLSGGQNFATLRPGQTGSDLYGFCTVDMEDGSLYLSLDATTYDEPGYKDLVEWTEDGQW